MTYDCYHSYYYYLYYCYYCGLQRQTPSVTCDLCDLFLQE